jgi:N-acetylneuraminic acid mutarotase
MSKRGLVIAVGYVCFTGLLFGIGLLFPLVPLAAPSINLVPVASNVEVLTPSATPTCAGGWHVVPSPNIGQRSNALDGVAAVSASDVWAVGFSHDASSRELALVQRWNGTSWSVVPAPQPERSSRLKGVDALSANDVWAVGYYVGSTTRTLIEHWNGTEWSVIPSPNTGACANYLTAVAAIAPDDVWAVGYYSLCDFTPQTLTMHWDGSEWTIVDSPNPGPQLNWLNGVTALTSSDVWAVGSYSVSADVRVPMALHWDGTSWSSVSMPRPTGLTNELHSVDAVTSSDVWAVGYSYGDQVPARMLIEHWNGTEWSIVPSPYPGTNKLRGVAALSANDIWAVGEANNQSMTVHWDGIQWRVVPTPNVSFSYLNAIDTVSTDDVWAVGLYSIGGNISQTLVEHYTGPCSTPTIVPTATATTCPPGSPDPWVLRAPQPSALYGSAAASDGSVVYVAGGSADGTVPSDILRSYNPATNNWTTLAPMPYNSAKASAVYAPNVNRLFVFGGDSLIGGSTYNLTRIYNPETDSWTLGAPMPGGRWGMAAGYYNGKIYLAGGLDATTLFNSVTTWEYDPVANSWNTDRRNMPSGVKKPGSAIINGHLYVAGGENNSTNVLDTLYSYDIAGDMWTIRASLPTALESPGSGALGGKLWIFGGETSSDIALSSTSIYDPATDIWTAGSNLNVARGYIAGAIVSNKIVAAGGMDAPIHTIYDTTETNTVLVQCVTATVTSTPVGTATATRPPATSTPVVTVTSTAVSSATPPCGPGWRIVPSQNPGLSRNELFGVAALSPTDAWAVGYTAYQSGGTYYTLIEHWDGSQWSVVPSPNVGTTHNVLYSVSVVSASDVWAVGFSTSSPDEPRMLALHWDGQAWTVSTTPDLPGLDLLRSVSARSSNDVWATGWVNNRSLAIHWNGSIWSVVPTPNVGNFINYLDGVKAIASDDVWAVGSYVVSEGQTTLLALHWDGSQWTVALSSGGINSRFFAVAASASNNVWLVGSENATGRRITIAYHWNGSNWTNTSSLSPGAFDNEFRGVKVFESGEVWAVGMYQQSSPSPKRTLTQRWNGAQWAIIPSPNAEDDASNELKAVSSLSSSYVWAVGSHYNSMKTLVEQYNNPCLTPTPTATGTYTPTSTSTPPSIPTATYTATLTRTVGPHTATATAISVPSPCPLQFTDVPGDHTFYANIRCLACRGIINGYSSGCATGNPCFKPGNNVTRGQLSKIVSNSAGFQEPAGARQFEDVLPGSTFYDFIWRLANRGYINGYPCGGPGEPCGSGNLPYFRPNTSVTRGQISKIVSNAAGFSEPAGAQQFEDVMPGSTFYDFIWRLADRGYMSGYPCGGPGEPCGGGSLPYFRPGANATRGQASKIVANTFFPNCQTP